MAILSIDHVQLAMPPEGEVLARAFYAGILGLVEIPKPTELAKRGGVWFGTGSVQIHLGVEVDFRPARKAHPALRVDDIVGLSARCSAAGHLPVPDGSLPGYERFYVDDPFGNRLEVLQESRADREDAVHPRPSTATAEYQILAISGSLRGRSSNTEALRAAAALAGPGVAVTLSTRLATLPHFNPDLDVEGAVLPAAVQAFRTEIGAADALLICSPEYAHGVPGVLKNGLDWLVSGPEIPFKPIGLLNVSSRSTHALASLAETLRTMSTNLVPGASLTLPLDGRRLDAEGIVAIPEFADALRSALDALVEAGAGYRRRRAEMV